MNVGAQISNLQFSVRIYISFHLISYGFQLFQRQFFKNCNELSKKGKRMNKKKKSLFEKEETSVEKTERKVSGIK